MMNDAGTTITMVGLIATLISIIFAMAALYVSRKKRAESEERLYTPEQKPRPHVRVEAEDNEQKHAVTDGRAAPGAPLFKKLGSRGVEEPVAAEDQEEADEYSWE